MIVGVAGVLAAPPRHLSRIAAKTFAEVRDQAGICQVCDALEFNVENLSVDVATLATGVDLDLVSSLLLAACVYPSLWRNPGGASLYRLRKGTLWWLYAAMCGLQRLK